MNIDKCLLLTLFSLLTACNTNSFAIEDQFTDQEKEMIYKAIDEWIEATDSDDAWIFTREGYHSGHEFDYFKDWIAGPDFPVIHKVNSSESGYKTLEFFMGGFDGLCLPHWRIAIVEDKVESTDHFYKILMHELGHFYGLDHEADGLMKAKNFVDCVDELTLGRFCDMYNCGVNKHSTCKD